MWGSPHRTTVGGNRVPTAEAGRAGAHPPGPPGLWEPGATRCTRGGLSRMGGGTRAATGMSRAGAGRGRWSQRYPRGCSCGQAVGPATGPAARPDRRRPSLHARLSRPQPPLSFTARQQHLVHRNRRERRLTSTAPHCPHATHAVSSPADSPRASRPQATKLALNQVSSPKSPQNHYIQGTKTWGTPESTPARGLCWGLAPGRGRGTRGPHARPAGARRPPHSWAD